ncbi:MAG: hypothetical protein WBF17_02880, partial [Phycisphaerae bacterium]
MAMRKDLSDSELFIEYSLRMTKGRIRLIALASASLLVLAVAAVYLLGIVVADHFVPRGLPAGARNLGLWVFWLLEAALIAWKVVAPLVRRINDLYVARLIEKAHPDFRNDLTAALQLSGDRTVHSGMLAAIRRRAANEVFQTNVEASVNPRNVALSGLVFAVAAGALAIYCLASSKPVLPSLRRALGNDELPAPTRTEIEVVQPAPEKVVLVGERVDFSALVRRGDGPVTVRISRDGGVAWLNNDMLTMHEGEETPDGAVSYAARWPAAVPVKNHRAMFVIACGDGRSKPRSFTVLPKPTVRSMTVTYDWPPYTGRGQTSDSGGRVDVEAVKGTTVTIKAEANLPVARASLKFEKVPPAIMTVQGRYMTGRFVLNENDRLCVVYKGTCDMINGRSAWCDVTAVSDQPPTVKLTEPVLRIELPVNDMLRLAGEVSDDFGFANIALVTRNGGAERRLPLEDFPPPGVPARPIEVSLPVVRLGQAGQLLSCRVEARDYCPPDGQAGSSETFELLITKPDEDIIAQDKAAAEAEENAGIKAPDDVADANQLAAADRDDVKDAVDDVLAEAKRDADVFEALRKGLEAGNAAGADQRNELPDRDVGRQDGGDQE